MNKIAELAAAAAEVRGSRNPKDWDRQNELAAECKRVLDAELAASGYEARVTIYPRQK